jgi:peptidoglycan/LPS O-acetylase OafA/YrhL
MNNAVVGQSRIRYLDGLRGLAILLVLGWHYIGPTYAANLPYHDKLTWIPLFNHGWVGVYLFFLISGYVIFMTIEDCSTFREFMKRRWLRLFPAMLLTSVLVFAVAQFLGVFMPSGEARLIDLLPGLTFISDSFWHAILHLDIHGLDGDFWTLYVEFGFYIVFGLSYFLLGWQRALACLIVLWLLVFAYSELVPYLPKPRWPLQIPPPMATQTPPGRTAEL